MPGPGRARRPAKYRPQGFCPPPEPGRYVIAGYQHAPCSDGPHLVCSLCVALPSRAEDLLLDRFGDYFDALRAQAGIPGFAAFIVGNNGVIWERAFGRQDTERAIITRTDTPFHRDGLTQMLRPRSCSAVSRKDAFRSTIASAVQTVRPRSRRDDTAAPHAYLGPIGEPRLRLPSGAARAAQAAIRACTNDSYRETLANRLARRRSCRVGARPGHRSIPRVHPRDSLRFRGRAVRGVLDRLAIPYVGGPQRAGPPSQVAATTLGRRAARFPPSVTSRGSISRSRRSAAPPETLAAAWRAPSTPTAAAAARPRLVRAELQRRNDRVAVRYSDSGSSSLWVTVPGRGLTLILWRTATAWGDRSTWLRAT